MPENDSDRLFNDLRQRQSNLLVEDRLVNGAQVDEVLWHGPQRDSSIQRAGVFLFGAVFLLMAVVLFSMATQQGWLDFLPALFFGTIGLRMLYKAVRGRATSSQNE